jgi:hypothetical protein
MLQFCFTMLAQLMKLTGRKEQCALQPSLQNRLQPFDDDERASEMSQ